MKYVAGQIKNLNLFKVLLLSFIFINVISFAFSKAHAGPARTTYQAKIIKPDGYPLEAASVNFKFTILDPVGTCILYSETYSAVNMSATGGLISFALGSGVKTYPVSATTFEEVFSNITPALSCDAGGPPTYSPAAIDSRKVVMQFHDGNGWQTLPAMSINAVPYAMYANQASNLNGKTDSDFVQVAGLPSCLSTEALRYNGTSFSCVNTASVSAAAVVSALGYTPATGASVTAIAASLSMTDADLASVSSTVFSVSSTVSSTVSSLSNSVSTLQSTVAASFAMLTSSQWTTSGTTINYMNGNVGIGTTSPTDDLTVSGSIRSSRSIAIGDGLANTTTATINAANFAWYGWYLGGVRTAFIQSTASEYAVFSQTSSVPMTFYTSSTERIRIAGNGNIGIGSANPVRRLQVVSGNSGGDGISIENSTSPYLLIRRDGLNEWYTVAASTTNTLEFRSGNIANSSTLALNANTSNVGIGTNAPVTRLDVSGAIRISMDAATCAVSYAGALRYNSGNLEMCNGTAWSAFGLASSGLTSLNGLTSATQTFANALAGTAPTFASLNGVHTLNIPLASAGSVTAGLISNADYVSFSNKITSSAASVAQALGYVPASATALNNYLLRSNNLSDLTNATTARTNLGLGGFATESSLDLGSASATGTIALARLPAAANVTSGTQYTKVTVDGYGRVTSGAQLSVTDVTTALGYTPASATASSQWATSGTTINYMTGHVGIGTTAPTASLDVVGSAKISGATDIGSGSLLYSALGYYGVSPQVTIGATTPTALRINVVDTGAFQVRRSGSSFGPMLRFGSSNGSLGAETVTTSGQTLGSISFDSYTGSGTGFVGYTPGASILGQSSGNGSPTNASAHLIFSTAASGSVAATERMRITDSGNIGIGMASPEARLHLVAGSSSLAPLKLTSGTLLSSPASGSIEYDGYYYYITNGSNVRRAIATTSAPGVLDTTNITSSANLFLSPIGSVVVSSTTASTNSATGALVVNGGVGIAGNINASGTLNISGDASFGGNVGIGTTTPTSKLNIVNAMAFDPGANVSGAIALEGAYGGGLIFKDTNYAGIWAADNGQTLNFSSNGTTSGFGGGAYGQMVLKASNVGIGTTNPRARLQLGLADWIGFEPHQGTSGLYFSEVGAMSASGGLTTHGARLFYDGTSDLLRFTTIDGSVEFPALNIARTTGNVGIGTTTPNWPLQVNANNSAGLSTGIALNSYENGSGTVGAVYRAFSTRGTMTNPIHVVAGDNLAGLAGSGYWMGKANPYFENGQGRGAVGIYASEDWVSSSNNGTYMSFMTTLNGTFAQAERMRIDNDGNVGIGTTAPAGKLHIQSPVLGEQTATPDSYTFPHASATAISGGLVYDGSYADGTYRSRFLKVDRGGNLPLYFQESRAVSNNYQNVVRFGTHQYDNNAFAVFGNANVAGNLGIGTTTPTARLQVNSGHVAVGLFSAGSVATNFGTGGIGFNLMRDQTNANWYTQPDGANNGAAAIYGNILGDLYFVATQTTGNSVNTLTDAEAFASTRMTVRANGHVGIGTTAPSEMLEVSGSVKAVAYLHTSDARLKKDIITLPDALENALKLRGVNFVWKNNNEKTIGFIAQEVEAVYPELVKTDKVTGYKAVQYGNIVAILVEALKEEHAQRIRSVANVEEKSNLRMNQLEKENQELKARLEKIEKFLSEKAK